MSRTKERAMRSRQAVAMMALLLALAWTDTASAAEPSSASIGPDVPLVEWVGQSFELADSTDPMVCTPEADPESAVCDHFWLTADVDASYWVGHDGRVTVAISWLDSQDDFDVYLFDDAGNPVASSVATRTTSEQVVVEEPVGVYEVRVIPVSVTASGYAGSALLSSAAVVPPEDTGDDAAGDGTVNDGSHGEANDSVGPEQDGGASGSDGRPGDGRSDGGGGSGRGDERSTSASSGSRTAWTSGESSVWLYNPSYEMRTFDTRTIDGSAVDQLSDAEFAPGLVQGEPTVLPPPVVPDADVAADSVGGTLVAPTTPPNPRSPWVAVTFGIIGLILMAVVVFDRLPSSDRSAVATPSRPAAG
jgi:hypothetical protein